MTQPVHSHLRRPLLEVLSLTKHFGEVKANTDVSLEVWPGEVHAIVGENGAGKSTLLKMIYGVYHPDSGQLAVDGKEAVVSSPGDARRLGIGMVFQDLRLVPAITVAENIALAMPEGLTLRLGRLAERIDQASRTFGLSVNASAKVGHLSIGERQRVEILKVLMTGARLVILDEPTSVLAPQEVEALFKVVDHLRAQDFGVVIVTHKLDEVRAIADRATVLRGGRTVLANAAPGDYTDGQLIEAMVGHSVADLQRRTSLTTGPSEVPPALSIEDVDCTSDRGNLALKKVSLTVRPGELVGIAGVAGSGQRELCEVALGLRRPLRGAVRINGQDVRTPASALAAGAAASPRTRWPTRSSAASTSPSTWCSTAGRSRPAGWESTGERYADAPMSATRPSDCASRPSDRKVSELSGGNIQRVVLTRELSVDASLVVAAYPSRGLDVANVRRTQELLLERRDAGAGVLMVSEDLDELMSIADRIVVMHDGHISGEILVGNYDRQAIGQLMIGGAA